MFIHHRACAERPHLPQTGSSANGVRRETASRPARLLSEIRPLAVPAGGWPSQVMAMAVGPIPTVIGGPAVLVAVRIGVTESVPPVT